VNGLGDDLLESMMVGRLPLSTSEVLTEVGNVRLGFGLDDVTTAHLFVNSLTMGWSIDTGSPWELFISPSSPDIDR
jgi:hypothetical protein